VNFGPYLKDVVATVRKNWYALIPADAKTKEGKLAIEFAIHKGGSITNLHLASASRRHLSGPSGLGRNYSVDSFRSIAQCVHDH